jgi:hypothetical protein
MVATEEPEMVATEEEELLPLPLSAGGFFFFFFFDVLILFSHLESWGTILGFHAPGIDGHSLPQCPGFPQVLHTSVARALFSPKRLRCGFRSGGASEQSEGSDTAGAEDCRGRVLERALERSDSGSLKDDRERSTSDVRLELEDEDEDEESLESSVDVDLRSLSGFFRDGGRGFGLHLPKASAIRFFEPASARRAALDEGAFAADFAAKPFGASTSPYDALDSGCFFAAAANTFMRAIAALPLSESCLPLASGTDP